MRLAGRRPKFAPISTPNRPFDDATSGSREMNRSQVVKAAKTAGTWAPAILLMLIFIPQGWSKFSASSGWATAFRHWGYPVWFRETIGVTELLAAALLLSGRFAAFGATLII